MFDDELFSKFSEDLKSNNISSKKDTFKSSSTEIENTNGELIGKKHPKTLFEIREALEKLKELREETDFNKRIFNKDKDIELSGFLSSGIVLDEIPEHDNFINCISSFLETNGFSRDFVVDNLRGMEGHVIPLDFLYGGKAQALRNHIDFDFDFFDYDEEGKVVGVSEDKKELYRHVVVHEFFHKLSSYKNGHDDVMVQGDALLEGFTDLFTKLALGDKVESDLYGFPVKVCEMFLEMMGQSKVLDDYINHTGEFPNLKNFFGECGLEKDDFLTFRVGLDSVIKGVVRDKNEGVPKEEWGLQEKTSSLDYLRDNIVIPYCRNNPDKAERILGKFNSLFASMDYSCSMEDIDSKKI